MSDADPARTAAGRRPTLLFAVFVAVSVTLIGVIVACQSLASSLTDSRASPTHLEHGRLDNTRHGAVPQGVTVFAETVPAVSKLDRQLLDAIRLAATDAAEDGVVFRVNSGWRSPEYQDRLLREAISEYGSEEEAARWVATADTSPHVSGDAIDVGDADATAWLSEQGAAYGLCQIYGNEPWHYELRPGAVESGCPRMYADPSQDPRMQP
jgi:hypothetical protein